MSVLKWLFILMFQFYNILELNKAQRPSFISYRCGDNRTEYPPNGAYGTNLNTLLSSVSSNMDSYGFYNASIGKEPDKVSVIAQCRGDLELQRCRECIHDASRKILDECPDKKWAIGYYSECQLRYSNESIIGTVSDDGLTFYMYNTINASSPQEFMQDLRTLLETLRIETSDGGRRKFASNNTRGPDFQTIFAATQCTADLSAQDCFNCLARRFEFLPKSACNGKQGCNILMPSCNLRFEMYRFINEPLPGGQAPPPSLPSAPPPKLPPVVAENNDKSSARTAIFIAVPSVAVVILSACIFVILRKKRQKRKTMDETESMHVDDISTTESLQYDISTIIAATDNFSNANKLGQGGFGPVYKGKLSNGKEVAVKRLSTDSEQGDLEFKNEMLLVAKLQHRNLVRLLGFCLDEKERLLIYEFIPNASLDHFLFNSAKRRVLDWDRRFKIIGGIAKAILYLHEDSRLRIIHRDLKASNILLDEEMNPKISDFGMARLFTLDETQGSTTKIVGTYGYMAPEYAMRGQFSVKSDVYSFGVLVLEILSGKKNTFKDGDSTKDLLSYAWENWRDGTTQNVIDPMLTGSSGMVSDMIRCIQIALLCVEENGEDRPTMAAVVVMLSSFSLSLPLPSYSVRTHFGPITSLSKQHNSTSTLQSGEHTQDKSICLSQNEASITDLYPR